MIATAILAEAATDVVQPPTELLQSVIAKLRLPKPPSIPTDILHDLWFIASAHPEDAIKRWESFSTPPRNIDDSDRTNSKHWRCKMVDSTDFVDLASDFARNFLIVTPLKGEEGSRRIIKMSFEERRRDTPITGDPDDGVSLPGRKASWKLRTYIWQIQRFLGLRAKRIVLPASSVSRAECFHLEIDVPEGIRLTFAKLRAYLPTKVVGDAAVSHQHNNDHLVDVVTKSTQCVHLHLANVPRRYTGAGILALRIGDGLVLRGAWINAVFTTAVLTLVSVDPGGMIHDPASAVAVLVGIPGGISLYIARSREPGTSTSMHAGVRMLALINALAAFGATVIILTAGNCKDISKPAKQVCTRWGGTNTSLIVLAAVAGLMLIILSITYYFSRRPPELRAVKAARTATTRTKTG